MRHQRRFHVESVESLEDRVVLAVAGLAAHVGPALASSAQQVSPVLEGPSGGYGGNQFFDLLARGTFTDESSKITAVTIRSASWIDSIQVDQSIQGSIFHNPRHGGTGGSPKTLTLGPYEYITHVYGTYGGSGGIYDHVISLHIDTNMRVDAMGRLGEERGVPFDYSAPLGAQIISFWGRSTENTSGPHSEISPRLIAIGVALAPGPAVPGPTTQGPTGGQAGVQFFDALARNKYTNWTPSGSKILRVTIRSGSWIDSIQVDQSIWGAIFSNPRRGGTGGSSKTLTLGPQEYITRVWGTERENIVETLHIDTNMRFDAMGKLGGEGGDPFDYSAPPGAQIISFWGRADSNLYLYAIGVAFAPLPAYIPGTI